MLDKKQVAMFGVACISLGASVAGLIVSLFLSSNVTMLIFGLFTIVNSVVAITRYENM